MSKKDKGWIGIDLDGTIALYDGWKGAAHIGEPIPEMVDRVVGFIRSGREVRIMTARVSPVHPPAEVAAARDAIERWCYQHLGKVIPITCEKDMRMLALYDDRAVQVEKNTGRIATPQQEWS